MGNRVGSPGSSSIEVFVPPLTTERASLISHLKDFYGVSVKSLTDGVRISGSDNMVSEAKNYIQRFLEYDHKILVSVSASCLSIFTFSDLVRHFEQRFGVFISPNPPLKLVVKGEPSKVDQFCTALSKLDSDCQQSSLTLKSVNYDCLHQFCRKFSINFYRLPSSPSVHMALLRYYSQLSPSVPKPSQPLSQPLLANAVSRRRPPTMMESRAQKAKSVVSEKTELAKTDPKKLRLVVIDGSNVAYEYGNKQFNPEGIRLAIEFFIQRGHTNVVAVVPRFRQAKGGVLFDKLEREGHLYYSPSRLVNGIQRVSDDDKVILEVAARENGVVVSNDQFRNYLHIDRLRSVIENRFRKGARSI
ncbi:putative ribonuclease zc3h12d, variant 2 [Clonorchis sinensis]|uniref:Ribonuclease zc3h12d, variant 2 n=1 Tax=Clonorchis sinensis TaxID=79923 RepID=A0A8T1M662_CLOSI|nr:putative ribonuclease zc3h12d, variant 2 [Clonorchis sinensis]